MPSLFTPRLSAAAAIAGLGLAAWSPASQACAYEPLMGAVCAMAVPTTRFQTIGSTYVLAMGQTMSVQQNPALYSLLGNMFGGSGQTTFNLPDLRGKVIVGFNPASPTGNVGATGGSATIKLTVAQLPPHSVQLANLPVALNGVTATTTLSTLSATANLAGIVLTGPASGLTIKASTSSGLGTPGNNYLGKSNGSAGNIYSSAAPDVSLNAGSITGNLSFKVDPGVTAPVTVGGTAATTLGGSATVSGSSAVVGAGADVPVMPPYLVLPYYIAVQGIYPTTD